MTNFFIFFYPLSTPDGLLWFLFSIFSWGMNYPAASRRSISAEFKSRDPASIDPSGPLDSIRVPHMSAERGTPRQMNGPDESSVRGDQRKKATHGQVSESLLARKYYGGFGGRLQSGYICQSSRWSTGLRLLSDKSVGVFFFFFLRATLSSFACLLLALNERRKTSRSNRYRESESSISG